MTPELSGSTRGLWLATIKIYVRANGRETHADLQCQARCVERIESIKEHGVVAIDNRQKILDEYRRHLTHSGGPGVGDVSYKHVFDNQGCNDRVRMVAITASADDGRGFDELPENRLDRSDRKFLAVAVAADAVLLNATDSDWGEQATLIQTLGVTVDQLCPQYALKAK